MENIFRNVMGRRVWHLNLILTLAGDSRQSSNQDFTAE